jgi:hypothetical protein
MKKPQAKMFDYFLMVDVPLKQHHRSMVAPTATIELFLQN